MSNSSKILAAYPDYLFHTFRCKDIENILYLCDNAEILGELSVLYFCMQGGMQKAPISITDLLRGLLRDITDITGFYCGYYGTFCVHFQ